jgi:predicted ferric reductase
VNRASQSLNSQFPVRILLPLVLLLLVGMLFLGALVLLLLLPSSAHARISSLLASLLATDSTQAWWYVTRAAGLTAYLLMWLSMVWGLAVSSRILHPLVEGSYSYDFHEFLSLLGLGFVLLHAGVLLFDRYVPYTLVQLLIPFLGAYRPFWVGIGILGFYILVLVTVTFYLKPIIGVSLFRGIHVLSLLGYLGVTLHGLFAGTDSALAMTKAVYACTALLVVFMTGYWLVLRWLTKREKFTAEPPAHPASRQPQPLPLPGRR